MEEISGRKLTLREAYKSEEDIKWRLQKCNLNEKK